MSEQTARFRFGPRAVVAMAVLAAGAATAQPSRAVAPPLEAAVRQHLDAVAARDLDALLPTLTSGDALTMIAPNGLKLDTRQQYVDFHRQWFATDDGGKYEAEIVRLIESPALGQALIKYRYGFNGPNGQPQAATAWLALTFALEGGVWCLVLDQNTSLTP